jgi:hypothetical protein
MAAFRLTYHGLEVSEAFIERVFEEQGPFDGIVGFRCAPARGPAFWGAALGLGLVTCSLGCRVRACGVLEAGPQLLC